MNMSRIVSVSVLLFSFVAFCGEQGAQPKPPTIHTGDVPIGSLGFPVGSYLTIEGVRVEGPKTGGRTLRVDTVNGTKLPEAVTVGVENIDALPRDVRCVLRGYETLQMVGSPPAYLAAAKEAGHETAAPQAGWQIRLYFVATSAVSPSDLNVKKNT